MQQSLNPKTTGSVNESSSQSNVIQEVNKSREKGVSDTQEIIINSKITAKDIRDSLWRCRDFELSHLWQRSIFLTTILILCFTGYGVITMKLLDSIEYNVEPSAYTLNNISLVLCLVNIVFSCLWIMMAKGSKAWYERYENAIDAFDYNEKYVCDEVYNSGIRKDQKGKRPIGGFQFKNLKQYEKPEINDCIFTCQGGAYSPSKINIAIGQISFVIWCLAFGIHYFMSIKGFHLDREIIEKLPHVLLIIALIILVFAFIPVCPWFKGLWIRSSVLCEDRNKVYKLKKKKTAPK